MTWHVPSGHTLYLEAGVICESERHKPLASDAPRVGRAQHPEPLETMLYRPGTMKPQSAIGTERALYGDVPDSEQDSRTENVERRDIHRDPDIHSGCENGTSSENAQSSSRSGNSPSGQSTVRDAIPLDMQQDMLSDWLLGGGREKMHAFIDEHWSEIIYAMWAYLEDEYEVRLYQKLSELERRRGVAGNMAVAAILLSGG